MEILETPKTIYGWIPGDDDQPHHFAVVFPADGVAPLFYLDGAPAKIVAA